MAYCRKCGNWLPDTALRCNVCGENRQPQQPQQPQYQQTQYQPRQPQQPQYQQPQYQQPQYRQPQQPQYQQPQYQQPQQPQQPQTWSIPKNGEQPAGQYPKSVELGARPLQQPPISEDPPKPPKKKGGKIALFIVIGVLALALIGTGIFFLVTGTQKDDPNVGRYNVVSCVQDGEEQETDGEWINLRERGKASIHLDYQTFSGEWELDGEDITITQDGDEFYGTLEDGILILDLDGLVYTFVKEGVEYVVDEPVPATTAPEAPPAEAPTDAPPPEMPATEAPTEAENVMTADAAEWWAGDWYGWWIVDEGWGHWEQYENVAWDVCATFTVDAKDGTGYVSMWDEDTGAQSRWEVEVYFVEGYDERGIMRSGSGTFMNAAMPNGDWDVNPAEHPYDEFGPMLHISGVYQDPRNSANRCEYSVFLRPWGMSWEDIRNGDMSDMPYTDMMPINYDSWYVPLMEGGKPMPNSFH